MREAAAAFMQKGASVTPEQLIITTGSQQALDLIGKTMISPGDKVIVEAPTFSPPSSASSLWRRADHRADRRRRRADRQAGALIDEHKPKFVYLIPTFGNPSGAMLSLERRKRILEVAAHQNADRRGRPYGELYLAHRRRPACWRSAMAFRAPRLACHCGSMSKILSPGLRRLPHRAAGTTRQSHHVQAVQRRPHQQPHAGHRRQIPGPRPPLTRARKVRAITPNARVMGESAKETRRRHRIQRTARRHVRLGATHWADATRMSLRSAQLKSWWRSSGAPFLRAIPMCRHGDFRLRRRIWRRLKRGLGGWRRPGCGARSPR